MYKSTEVIERLTASQMCQKRDEAIALIHKSMEALSEADKILTGIAKYGLAFQRDTLHNVGNDAYKMRAIDNLTKQIDTKLWQRVVELGQFRDLMTVVQQRKLSEQIESCPPFTIETVTATVGELLNNRPNMLRDLVETSFKERSKGYKSNKGMKINKRQIIGDVFDRFGYFSRSENRGNADRFNDIVKSVSILLGCDNPHVSSKLKVDNEITEFDGKVRFKAFKNGNVHIWIECEDLLNKLNDVLAGAMGAKVGEI